MTRRSLLMLISAWLIFASSPVKAIPDFLTAFETEYPSSQSSDSECQLCHVNPGGNSPWNEYGWRLRQRLNVLSIQAAIQSIANEDSDGENTSNSLEIGQDTQPGWAVGNVNTYYPSSGAPIANQPPPISLPAGILIDPGATATPGEDDDPITGGVIQGDISIRLATVASGFTAPILAQPLEGENNLYVVQQTGEVMRVDLSTGVATDYVDFSGVLVNLNQGYDERGLLGFAFHPNFSTNGKVYTHTSEAVNGAADFSSLSMGESANHQSVIREWVVSNHANTPATTGSTRVLMRVDQPQSNHNGGMIEFGPDGFLYIAFGDGGGRDDEGVGHPDEGNSQAFENPLGALLRIDVDGSNSDNGQYGIPVGLFGNPFVDGAQTVPGLDEAYAFGFRNPYRFSIDDLGGGDFNIYVGDVGQGDIEEVSLISSDEPGGNYGWRLKEGSFFFYTDSSVCGAEQSCVSIDPPQGVSLPNMVDPILEYDHDEGVSVIGGYVYRGSSYPNLSMRYVFGEFSNGFGSPNGRLFYQNAQGNLREFRYVSAPNLYITSLARDNTGELYVLGSQSFGPSGTSGELKRIEVVDQQELNNEELCLSITANNNRVVMICL